ncbi:MAG: hypothetical protein A2840_00100 [Candidatus Buchananbacteria bacterium RIFCSPHIGHO2_01_FULL_47_11b]|uniref:Uncharacterized protein n=1 Tax=Candidatus Buchananbacteria bacterium RIFCSPHIGHO2_01_FULL_47_11b TaxID=1797537 RepID=A0A1G1Y5Q4_9BACT|nr:MAG: hypothetical protein A2840_00100 [Candidatus Buchananbacteria bacterium RIFCSPHIGHO2_01_FULL_47_11b]
MKLKFPKLSLPKLLLSLKYVYLVITLIVIASVGLLGWFLYKNLYQTIAQTEEIQLLRQEVAPDIVNINQFTSALDKLNLKTTTTQPIDWKNKASPFGFNVTPPQTDAQPVATSTPATPDSQN